GLPRCRRVLLWPAPSLHAHLRPERARRFFRQWIPPAQATVIYCDLVTAPTPNASGDVCERNRLQLADLRRQRIFQPNRAREASSTSSNVRRPVTGAFTRTAMFPGLCSLRIIRTCAFGIWSQENTSDMHGSIRRSITSRLAWDAW